MIITDPFSNLFSNINNGLSNKKYVIYQKKSTQIISILNTFLEEGLIKSYKILKENPQLLQIRLKIPTEEKKIIKIERISRPGKRSYSQWSIPSNNVNFLFILSTVSGFMTDKQAYKIGLGGEMICKINLC